MNSRQMTVSRMQVSHACNVDVARDSAVIGRGSAVQVFRGENSSVGPRRGGASILVYISVARTASRPASTTECYTGTENNIDERARYCPGTNAAIMISKAKKTE